MKHHHYYLIICFCALLNSCNRKDEAPRPVDEVAAYGKLQLDFTNVYGDSVFQYNQNYVTDSGDTFQLSDFRYVISSITLVNSDFEVWTATRGFYVVQTTNNQHVSSIVVDSVPVGEYSYLSFQLGFKGNQILDTSLLYLHHSDEIAQAMFSDDKLKNLHFRMDGSFKGNEGKSGDFQVRNSVTSYNQLYEFGTLTSASRVSHSTPATRLNLFVEENQITKTSFETHINWLFNQPVSIDFDNDYTSNLNTVLQRNYSYGLFNYINE